MSDHDKVILLQQALNETRDALLAILSPAIDRQLTPERRQRGHNAIDLAAGALQDTGFAKDTRP